MGEFNKQRCQNGFEKYNKGLREEIEGLDFTTKQDVTNFVRSKLNKLWINKNKKIYHKEGVLKKLEEQNQIMREALEFYADKDNWYAEPATIPACFEIIKKEDLYAIEQGNVGGFKAREALKKVGK